jgi:hypothetical protein
VSLCPRVPVLMSGALLWEMIGYEPGEGIDIVFL